MRRRCSYYVCMGLAVLLLCSCRSGCHLTDEDWPERISHDTVQVYRDRVDSVFQKDSIYIHEKGDTVWLEKWHTKYQVKVVTRDSIIVKVDSIPYPVEVVKEVKYTPKLTKWLASIGGLLIAAGLGLAGWKIYRIFR